MVLMLALSSAFGQGITTVLSGPASPVENGGRVSVWLTLLNDSPTDLTRSFPEKLTGRVVSGQESRSVEMIIRTSGEPVEVRVLAGRFVRREYEFSLPESIVGRVLVELSEPAGVNPIVIQVQPPPPVAQKKVEKGGAFVRFFKDAEAEGQPFDAGAFFKQHISGYDPFYFLAGTESPNAKFQVSLKYQLLNSESGMAERAPALAGFHFAYSQTSLWDWNADSAPFFDSSYRPEMLYVWERVLGGRSSNWFRLDLQGGVQHESNGKGGADSRSLNIAYFKPTLTFGRPDSLQLSLSPRVWLYVLDLDDNPDIKDYRGYADLRAVLGWAKGVQLAAIGRLGDDWDHGSLQLDLTYPMMRLLSGSFSLYLHAQYFTGYGESLLLYDEKGSSFRIGFSLYR